jgi:hypothetical protein
VIVLVVALQTPVVTSATNVPKLVRVLLEKFQIRLGKVDARDEDAARTVALVFVLTASAIDVVAELFQTLLAIAVVDALAYPMTNVLSRFARSPLRTLPQVIVVGQIPSVYRVVVL